MHNDKFRDANTTLIRGQRYGCYATNLITKAKIKWIINAKFSLALPADTTVENKKCEISYSFKANNI